MSGPPPESKAVPHFHGHRERLKARFHETGAEKFADYELLELILYLALPRRDTKPLAKALMAKFGTFSAVLAAPRARLQEVAGIGDAAVHALKLVQGAAQRYARDGVRAALSSIAGPPSSITVVRQWRISRSSSSASSSSTARTR
jgi:DNA repair protein RadC